MTIAGRQTAPHAARLIGSGLSRRPAEDSAAQLRGVCTPGRIRTGVLLQFESDTTCSRNLHGSKSACMQANKEGVRIHLHAGQLQIATALACAHAHMASSTLRPCPKWLRRAPTTSTTNHVDHVSSGSAELQPHRPRTTSTTSRAALPSSDHLNHQTTSQ